MSNCSDYIFPLSLHHHRRRRRRHRRRRYRRRQLNRKVYFEIRTRATSRRRIRAVIELLKDCVVSIFLTSEANYYRSGLLRQMSFSESRNERNGIPVVVENSNNKK